MANVMGDWVWYELMTPDAAGAQVFYSSVLDWKIADPANDGFDYREIQTSNGDDIGGLLGMTPDMIAGGAQPGWVGYITVPDVDSSIANIVQAGGKLFMPPRDLEGVGRFAMVGDPQGVPIYVMTSTTGETSNAHGALPGQCSWNELTTSDPQAAVDFYTSQFGWTKGDVMPMGEMGDYLFLKLGERVLGAAMRNMAGGPPPRWTYYFRVTRIDAAVDKVKAGGGQILHGPQEVPGGDQIIVGMDPQGAMFALVAAKK
jgi:uncharacterized protein